MADSLEISKRTIYRDIVTLQAMRTPIYGEAGSAMSCAKVTICHH
jgi:Predicted transcriptional regulator